MSALRAAKDEKVALNLLDALESESIYIIREAFRLVRPLCTLWSIGKDSTALLWLIRKAFFGRMPFPVVHLDTGMELDEVYAFRDRLIADWQIPFLSVECPPESEVDPTLPPASRAAARKTAGLKKLIAERGFKGILVGIRRDEQATRAKERVFSPRNAVGAWHYTDQPMELWGYYATELAEGSHLRIHPLLHWSEIDIWRYTLREGIPTVPLYFAKDGKRYRSLGEKNITLPIDSQASTLPEIIAELEATREPERAGRVMDYDSEDAFERLRVGGYM